MLPMTAVLEKFTSKSHDAHSLIRDIVQLLKVLADPTRLHILEYLKANPEKTVTRIQRALHKQQPIISQNLKTLQLVGLVRYRQEGSKKFFSIEDEAIFDVLATLHSVVPDQGRLSKVLKVWGDETRLTIITLLLDLGEVPTALILDHLDKHASTISQQMKKLVRAGIVSSRRDGIQKIYQIAHPQARNLVTTLAAFVNHQEEVITEKIVIMGLHKSGKTSIMRSLMGVRNLLDYYDLAPTRGIERAEFTHQHYKYFIWECGGQERYREDHLVNLDQISRETDKLIYVIDVQDVANYTVSLQYLEEVIQQLAEVGRLEDMDVAIYLHKYDPGLELEPGFTDAEIEAALLSKIDAILPAFRYALFRTTIYTVFQKSKIFRE